MAACISYKAVKSKQEQPVIRNWAASCSFLNP